MEISYSISNIPSPILGLSLGNVGISVMLLNLSNYYGFRSSAIIIVYFFTLLSLLYLFIYLLRIIILPTTLKTEFSTPNSLVSMGSMAMALCLLSIISRLYELNIDTTFSFTIACLGTLIQTIGMMCFFVRCCQFKTMPEPFFNVVIHSCLFPVLALSGNSQFEIYMRKIYLSIGLITLVPSTFIQLWRVVIVDILEICGFISYENGEQKVVVANSPQVCMMMAAWSISLSAWIKSPLTPSSQDYTSDIVIIILFTMTTSVYVLNWFAIIQRRLKLYSIGFNDPSWSAATFPFCNCAISGQLFFVHITSKQISYSGYVCLAIWIWTLTTISFITIIFGNFVYFKNVFFIRKLILVKESVTTTGSYKEITELSTDNNKNNCNDVSSSTECLTTIDDKIV